MLKSKIRVYWTSLFDDTAISFCAELRCPYSVSVSMAGYAQSCKPRYSYLKSCIETMLDDAPSLFARRYNRRLVSQHFFFDVAGKTGNPCCKSADADGVRECLASTWMRSSDA